MAREIRGGLVTFVTMAYIVVLNPLIIGSFVADAPGAKTDVLGNVLPVSQVAAVTARVGAVAGGAASSSSNTVYIESAAGIAEGARTGLANAVTGLLFLGAMFCTPLYTVIPIEAAAPALVVVGALLVAQVREIDFSDFIIALPAFLTIVVMPFTYSIANGIGAGFISYALLHAVIGRARTVHPLVWVVAVAFTVYFVQGPLESLLGAS